MERNEYTSIPAEKFRFVQANEKLHDKALKTKPIGYFKASSPTRWATASTGTP